MPPDPKVVDAVGRAFFVILAKRDGLATQEAVNAAMTDLADAQAEAHRETG